MVCELYPATPLLEDTAGFIPVLERALACCQPAALLLRLAPMPDIQAEAQLSLIQPIIQDRGIALMLEDRPELARQAGCDGVHLSPDYRAHSVAEVRRLLGDTLQLGVGVGASRDSAMRAGEDGADYICFAPEADAGADGLGQVVALAQWWVMMMELPVVACAHDPEQIAALVGSGADFVMPDTQWWDNPVSLPG
ncbi:thiamine phosphate synthase [Acetobacter vaccinii]|uniref:Thiamine phosphate synthase n=1 Tax=Acetobacter vaccinii TaxID=2592655 RepID=A0A5C1YLC5_9PROT|nr:thiamine phosphate synthase [Acetobacter vaccinii]QEO16773.1 thiamine phosphate synthase [Acetobacter vaccinii]